MINLNELKSIYTKLEPNLQKKIESIILFGSYARNEQNKNSDIDILVITKQKTNKLQLNKEFETINNKIELLILTKKEFGEQVLTFNHQLITLFLDAITLYDKNKFYYKKESLFLALNRKKKFTLKIRNKTIKLEKLIRKKNYI